jgi:glycosyltransferase involved in cell wall biosynthesis
MSKPLYVLSQLFYPELISTGLTLTELCEGLSEKNLNIHILCAQPTLNKNQKTAPKHDRYKDISITRLWSTRFSKLNTIGKAMNHLTFALSLFFYCLFLPQKSQLLVLTNPPIAPLLMYFLTPLKRFEYSVLLFDLYPETIVAAGLCRSNNPLVLFWKFLNKGVYNKAKHVIVIGRCMQDRLAYYYKKTPHNIRHIPIWCDNKNIEDIKSPKNFRKIWNLENSFILGYSGNMARFHDIKTFLLTAKRCLSSPDIQFVFVGEGYQKKWAQQFTIDQKLTNCHFLPYVEREELSALLHSFDCGLVSLNNENTGLSVPSKTVGLIAAGLPILAVMNDHCEMSRLINNHQLGLTALPGDVERCFQQVMTLYKDKQLRNNMHQNCHHLSKHELNLQTIVNQYIELFRK